MGNLLYYIPLAILAYPLIFFLRKSALAKRQKKEEEVLQWVYRTGRVTYLDKVYSVREVCDSGLYFSKKGTHRRYLVVSRTGEERVFRIPLEKAKPYTGA